MKKLFKKTAVIVICAALVFSLTACSPLDTIYGGIFDHIFVDILGFSKKSGSEETTTAQEETSAQSPDEEGSGDDSAGYSIPEYTGYDEEVIAALCEELSSLASGSDFDKIKECYDELISEFDLLYDQELLAYMVYCTDAANSDYYDDYNELYLMLVEYADEAYMAMKEVLAGPCADEFTEYIGTDAAAELEEYEELTDQELEWAEEENDLIAEYNAAYEEFDASGSSDYEDLNEAVGDIYLELVALRTEMAQFYGYDDYAQYADAEIYGRDFSTQEAEIFHEAVKEVSEEFYNILYGSYAYFGFYYSSVSFESDTIINTAYTYGSGISSYITDTLDVMLEYSLLDVAEDDARINGSFSTSYSSGAPTMFVNMDGWSDFQTFTHELGHCVNTYLTADRGNVLLSEGGCYDILEIHSNGLEALYTNYYDDIFGSYSNYAYSFTLMELMVNVVDGALYDEFQREVYENPDMTLDEINDLFESLSEEYGNPYASSGKYSWVAVSHNFESPMYYISYGVSALAALQIWALSVEDYDEAVSVWEEIVSTDTAGLGYFELLESSGLESFVDDDVAQEVCSQALSTAYSLSAQSSSGFYGFGR